MDKLSVELKALKKEINALSKKLDRLSVKAEKLKQIGKKPKAKPKAKANPKGKRKTGAAAKASAKESAEGGAGTPTDQILKIMKRYKKGINVSKIKQLTGFSDKQISNVVHRANKKGRLERVERGVYKLV